jgi:tetratricopeptide (TPR) repeat protein
MVDRSLDANALNIRAYSLKASLLRILGRNDEALKLLAFAREKTDPLDVRLMAEQWLLTKDPKLAKALFETMNAHNATAQETAAEYYNSNLWKDGLTVLQQSVAAASVKNSISPIVYYYMGYFAEKLGDADKAAEYRKQAAIQPTDYVFPFQDENISVLKSAIAANPADARAHYYLGNLLYDWQPDEATRYWEKSSALDPGFPITWRNLAIAYSHQKDDDSKTKAVASLEKAITSGKVYPTHLIELDRLYQSTNASADKRLATLEKYQSVVVKNDEALGNLITLKNFAGKSDESIRLLQNRIFSIWEGGTAFNSGQAWVDANIINGLQQIKKKKYNEAIANFNAAPVPPENLRAEQRFDARDALLSYWKGCAYDALGEKEKAKQAWNEVINPVSRALREGVAGGGTAAGGGMGPGAQGAGARRTGTASSPLAQGEQRYYETLARQKLGNKEGAKDAFNELITMAETALKQPAGTEADMPQITRRQQTRPNSAVAHYVAGLGYTGLGDKKKAREEFTAALTISPDYVNAKIALDNL